MLGQYSKSFLWHFDETWFDPGREFPTFDLAFGRAGIFVCADGRMPEIARLLGAGGSRLMVDSTAWGDERWRSGDAQQPAVRIHDPDASDRE